MNLSNIWRAILFISIIIINNCVTRYVSIRTTPWMALIQSFNLLGDDNSYEFHCSGVLMEQDVVVTSAKCTDIFPENSQMILFAGSSTSRPDWTDAEIQKFLPFGVQLVTNEIITISISPPIHRTKYVDYIANCKGENCYFGDKFGYQYGWDMNQHYSANLEMTKYDFSNSSALCLELNESPENKYCTRFNCNGGKKNYGGEPLTKLYKGQTYLMGFWDYDLCGYERDIRVFKKFSHNEPLTDVGKTP